MIMLTTLTTNELQHLRGGASRVAWGRSATTSLVEVPQEPTNPTTDSREHVLSHPDGGRG